MKTKNEVKRFVLFAFFVAIELVLMFTPLGFIPIGVIRATTLHIPVIICAIVLGYKEGILLGFIFGLASLTINTFTPSPSSFLFSPFIKIGDIGGNYASLIITFVPRMLLGFSAKFFYDLFKKFKLNENITVGLSSVLSTFLHTTLVLSGIYIFFKEPYAILKNIAVDSLFNVLVTVVLTNGIMEMVIGAIISLFVIKSLNIILKKGISI